MTDEHEQLRRDRPDHFAQDPDTYWNGFLT